MLFVILRGNTIEVLFGKVFDSPSYKNIISLVNRLRLKYRPAKIYVDAAKPDFIKSLKIQFREKNYESVIEQPIRDKITSMPYANYSCFL
jgi:CTP:phosphocholine cytidylyltransferase-like protein